MAYIKKKEPVFFLFYYVLFFIFLLGLVAFCATEDYSEGERIGFITKFSKKGRFWKSWEGELNLTQTGMNTSSTFQFSIDNDDANAENTRVMIDSAANLGWKIKLDYHETYFKNWLGNRGETNHFIRRLTVLDRHSLGASSAPSQQGRVVDTIYLVIDKSELKKTK
jgi:hypothetical protein